ncbi:uncharacterized protein LOC110036487 [Phalaenopsis equestris]|uniref:uncharacterized protein LOC110036487 n=1 Tax=Phalaenopsis equestris TaxID=78828 RepID=UPI0009E6422C|nr:uncharacterized protein LOC110036487 [Phalaenopsis equestris]
MASSASIPSKPVDDDLKLDELVSELHALKKLYGLLQSNSARPVGPDQPTNHILDEKSKHLLKKLLDGATQQTLQSQAKIISCTPEAPKSHAGDNSNPSINDLRNGVRETQENRECQPTILPVNSPEATESIPAAQPNTSEPRRHKDRRSKDATFNRCRANDSMPPDRRLLICPSESESRRNSFHKSKTIRIGGSERQPSSEKDGELLTLVPVQKRARVEPVDLPSRVSSRTNKPDRVDRELTHQKRTSRKQPVAEPSSIRSMQRTHSSKHQSSRSIVVFGDQKAQSVQNNGQSAERKQTGVPSNKQTKKVMKSSSSSKESTQSFSTGSIPLALRKQNRMKAGKKIISPPHLAPANRMSQRSRGRELSLRSQSTLVVRKNDQCKETKRRGHKPSKLALPKSSKTGRYSSSSTASTSRSNSVRNMSSRPHMLIPRMHCRENTRERRRASPPTSPKLPIPHNLVVSRRKPAPCRPARTRHESKPEAEEQQGRFKKLSNKLAIIFHHHHHHHLHAGEDEKGNGGAWKDHERTLWKYLKGFLHARKGSGEEQGKLHRNNLRVMMEWFFRHLWLMGRRRRKKVERRRPPKKVRWWQWFMRKGGVVVGGRRQVRLGNGSHWRTARGKG